MDRRVHYIDWLRVLAVLLLFPFHTSRVFNVGEPFYVKSAHVSLPLGFVLGFIGLWHMPLLFLLAGASTYFALRKRTGGEYAIERVKRLLVPLLFGFFVLIPPQTWLGGRFNAGYAHSFVAYLTSGDFLRFNLREGSDYYGGFGLGHLWFIEFLLVISLVALPLLLWMRDERNAERVRSFARRLARPAWWLLPPLLLLVAEGLPDLYDKNPWTYLVFFVLGYVVMADGAFVEAATRWRWPALGVGFALGAFWTATGWLRDSLPDPSIPIAALVYLGLMGAWLTIVGIVGCGRRYLDQPSPTLAYLAEASYPVYIIHQTAIVIAAFYLVRLPVGGVAQWLAVFLAAALGTFGLYELVRRIPPLRSLFGMRPRTRTGVRAGV